MGNKKSRRCAMSSGKPKKKTGKRTLSVHREHEFLLKLETAGLKNLLLKKLLTRKTMNLLRK